MINICDIWFILRGNWELSLVDRDILFWQKKKKMNFTWNVWIIKLNKKLIVKIKYQVECWTNYVETVLSSACPTNPCWYKKITQCLNVTNIFVLLWNKRKSQLRLFFRLIQRMKKDCGEKENQIDLILFMNAGNSRFLCLFSYFPFSTWFPHPITVCTLSRISKLYVVRVPD